MHLRPGKYQCAASTHHVGPAQDRGSDAGSQELGVQVSRGEGFENARVRDCGENHRGIGQRGERLSGNDPPDAGQVVAQWHPDQGMSGIRFNDGQVQRLYPVGKVFTQNGLCVIRFVGAPREVAS